MSSLPPKLLTMNLFQDGVSHLGEVKNVTPPPLTRKMEEYRGAGMLAPVQADMGLEALEMEWTAGGWLRPVLTRFGATRIDAVQLRFAAGLRRQDTGAVDAVEIVVRGRHTEIGRGESAPGEDTEMTVKTALSFYAEYWNGQEVIYIDIMNGIERYGGVDANAALRAAIGQT